MDLSTEVGVYEVSIIERPTVKAQESGSVARLILPPTAVIANGRSAAIMEAARILAGMSTPPVYDAQRIHTMVRRFRGDNA
jgi:hypothetical protein